MLSNRLAFALLGLVCVAAAGGGAYVATRQNAPDRLALPVAEGVPTPGQPVETTEATLDDLPPAAPVAPEAPVPFRAPSAKRTSPVAEPRPRDVSPKAATPASPRTAKPASSSPDRTAPSSAPAATETPAPVPIASVPSRVEELRPVEPARLPQEPPAPSVRELVVSADSVLGLQLESTVSSERARVEDRVDARVVRDVRVGSDVAIPAGARAVGSVMSVERGGRLKERARLGIRFHTLVLADGTEVPITSETIYRNGDAPGQGSAAKIGGGAVAGAILGAILGGGKGAAIGGAAGAGAGTATVMAGDRSEAVFQSGAELTARIVSPVTVIVDK
jgi:type IV secretory pathway VirB10-like protein